MHQITNQWTFVLNWSRKKAREQRKKKHHCCTKCVCFQMTNKRSQPFIMWVRKYSFLKNYVTSQGTVSNCLILPTALHHIHTQNNLWKLHFRRLLRFWDTFENPERLCPRMQTNPYLNYTIWETLLSVTLLRLWTGQTFACCPRMGRGRRAVAIPDKMHPPCH